MKSAFATRLAGSADLYNYHNRYADSAILSSTVHKSKIIGYSNACAKLETVNLAAILRMWVLPLQ